MRGDADYEACRAAPNLVWLGARADEEAARLILCADVGIVPFKVEPFNDAGLPYRILKYARLGRRTVAPPLAGVAHVGAGGDDRRRRRRVGRRAARRGGHARRDPDTRAARVGARADRARARTRRCGSALRELGIVSADPAQRRVRAEAPRTRTTGAKPGSGTLVSGLAPSAKP